MALPFSVDVVFTQEGAMLSVASKIFPGLMGVGFNQQEALEDLRRSIKMYLKEQVEKAVDKLFKVPVHEHVTLENKRPRHHVSFDVRPMLGIDAPADAKKNVHMSFPLPRYDRMMPAHLEAAAVEIVMHPDAGESPVRNLFEQLGLGLDLAGIQASGLPSIAGHANTMIVGLPLNYN